MNWILWSLIWLAITELFYFWVVTTSSKRSFYNDFFGMKLSSIGVGLVFTIMSYGCSLLKIKDLIALGIITGGVTIVVGFFVLNYWFGTLILNRKNKNKKSKNKKRKVRK